MTNLPRLALAIAAATSITVGVTAQPAYAAHKQPVKTARLAVHRPQPAPIRLTPAQARAILIRAARHHNLNPNFVLAVSYWESGWNQAARSRTGAVGLMQVEPYTAAWAGPRLLHRRGNIQNTAERMPPGVGHLRSL